MLTCVPLTLTQARMATLSYYFGPTDTCEVWQHGARQIALCGSCTLWLAGTPWVNATLSVQSAPCGNDCTSLDLSDKGIVYIANGTFAGMPTLQELYLWSNGLVEVHSDTFTHNVALRTLGLGGYSHKTTPPYRMIAKVHMDTFKHNTALEILVVQGFSLVGGPDMFKHMTKLRHLNLTYNSLIDVHPDTFKHNVALQELWLMSPTHSLVDVHPDTFKYNTALRKIWLAGNRLEAMHPQTFQHNAALEELEIWDNPLGCVPGVPEDVVIDKAAINYGARETPRCPSDCTTATYYDDSTDACFPCGAGTFAVGVGAVTCSRVASASTATPSTAAPTGTHEASARDACTCPVHRHTYVHPTVCMHVCACICKCTCVSCEYFCVWDRVCVLTVQVH
jgi:hypothetical protein